MMKLAMSRAASALLSALIDRAGVERDRILLSEFRSVDWQSLTFVGERHLIRMRLPQPDADSVLTRLTEGIEDSEFDLGRYFVADIAVKGEPVRAEDGSLTVTIEALTVAE
jgi:hypothetical protein